jgi:RHS repeat-associated protein
LGRTLAIPGGVSGGHVTGFDRGSTVTYPDSTYESYSYDADSNILTRRTRKGDIIGFSYDSLNRLITKTPPSGTGPTVTYAYDQGSGVVGLSDTSAAITLPAASSTFSQNATFDALNRPITRIYSGAASQATPTATSVTFNHAYDANNRRVSQASNDNTWMGYPAATSASTSYTANNLNQYTAVGSVTPTYDANGSLTYDGQFTYVYDVENRLSSITGGGSTVATYAYDAQGRRRSKTVGSAITVYVTDEDNKGMLDYDGTSGAMLHWYPAGAVEDLIGGTRATFITDIQGSVIGLLSSSGTLTKMGYQPFGENASLTSDGYRYTGQPLDAETAGSTAQPSGLYYLRSRMYSPTLGRFLQPDTIGYGGGANMYAYAHNDPLNFKDPSGKDDCDEDNCVDGNGPSGDGGAEGGSTVVGEITVVAGGQTIIYTPPNNSPPPDLTTMLPDSSYTPPGGGDGGNGSASGGGGTVAGGGATQPAGTIPDPAAQANSSDSTDCTSSGPNCVALYSSPPGSDTSANAPRQLASDTVVVTSQKNQSPVTQTPAQVIMTLQSMQLPATISETSLNKRACNFGDFVSQTLKAGALISGAVVVVGGAVLAAPVEGAAAGGAVVGGATVAFIGFTGGAVLADGVNGGYRRSFESGVGAAASYGIGEAAKAAGKLKVGAIGLVASAVDYATPNCT